MALQARGEGGDPAGVRGSWAAACWVQRGRLGALAMQGKTEREGERGGLLLAMSASACGGGRRGRGKSRGERGIERARVRIRDGPWLGLRLRGWLDLGGPQGWIGPREAAGKGRLAAPTAVSFLLHFFRQKYKKERAGGKGEDLEKYKNILIILKMSSI